MEFGTWSADISLPPPGHRLADSELTSGTGRRRVPWDSDLPRIIGHLHRYAIVAALGAGKRVLDLGAGEGFGAALLGTRAAEVVAIDSDMAAVVHALESYGRASLRYEHFEAPRLDLLESSSFDVISCLGIWTSVGDTPALIAETHRLLVPGGVAVFSSCAPRRDLFSPMDFDGRPEPDIDGWLGFSADVALLQESFNHVRLAVQSVDGASELHELDDPSSWDQVQVGRSLSVSRDVRHLEVAPDNPRETALIVVTSTNPIDLTKIPTWFHWTPSRTGGAGLEFDTPQLLDALEHDALARLAGMLEIGLEEALEALRAARVQAATLEIARAAEAEREEKSRAEAFTKAEPEEKLRGEDGAANGHRRLGRRRANHSGS